MAMAGILHDEIRVRRLGNRPAMDEDDRIRLDRQRGCRPGIDDGRAIRELECRFRPDRTAGGQAEMADDDIRPGPAMARASASENT